MSGSQRRLHNLRFLIVQAPACGNLPQAEAFLTFEVQHFLSYVPKSFVYAVKIRVFRTNNWRLFLVKSELTLAGFRDDNIGKWQGDGLAPWNGGNAPAVFCLLHWDDSPVFQRFFVSSG